MSSKRRRVSATEMRRARNYLRQERPADDDRWHSDEWLAALRAVGVPEQRLGAQYDIVAIDIAARTELWSSDNRASS